MSRKAVQVGLAPNCCRMGHPPEVTDTVYVSSQIDSLCKIRRAADGPPGGMNGGTMFYFGFDYFKLVIMRTVRVSAMAAVAGAAAWFLMMMAAMIS